MRVGSSPLPDPILNAVDALTTYTRPILILSSHLCLFLRGFAHLKYVMPLGKRGYSFLTTIPSWRGSLARGHCRCGRLPWRVHEDHSGASNNRRYVSSPYICLSFHSQGTEWEAWYQTEDVYSDPSAFHFLQKNKSIYLFSAFHST
jgi:hypothetical protein